MVSCRKGYPIDTFINKYCELGEDCHTDRYRVTLSDLYKKYKEKHSILYEFEPLCEIEFNNYLTEQYKLTRRNANWTHHTYMTWFNIRLKEVPKTIVQQLVHDFIDERCEIGEGFMIDTKLLYDEFERFGSGRGHETIKQNGFSRHNLRREILNACSSVKIKEWAINGHKHAFHGIKLRNQLSVIDVIGLFIEQKCVKCMGLRVKRAELYESFKMFNMYYNVYVPKTHFYKIVPEQNPELVCKCKCVTQDKGYVGITLREQ